MFESEELTLVPRVKSFTNQYVTKAEGDEAAYTQAETKITHLAYLIFDSNGALVHKAEDDVQNGAGLTLNKTNLNSSETVATVVMFANVNLADIKKANSDGTFTSIGNTLTLEEFDDYSIHPTSDPVVLSADLTGSGFKGFPMKGIAQNVNLTTSSKNPIVVSLQILYAKINFDISVAAGTENQNYEGVTPSFTLSGYSVTNVPTSTPVKTLNDDETLGDIESTPSGTIYEHTGTESDPSKTVSLNGTSASTFTFYMAESRYNHGGTDGVYPANLPDESKQQYKPQLATTGTGSPATGLATYVKINGTYIDYRGTSWTVNYKVYLGKNSYDNFHVDRNSEYKNYLTIKGIRNNDSYTDAGSVWIDHRVDVSTDDLSKHITITRETLIDSHIEVRPLRVKWDGETYAGVRVYLPTESNGSLVSWIGMERFTGENCLEGSTYCYVNGVATGKRKYFTTSLITELQAMGGEFGVQSDNGKKYLYLLNDECVWIYFDEHTGNTDREAIIRLEFYSKDGNSTTAEEYIVKQRGLRTVEGYAIESYEEYLHTYDSADKYNLSTSPVDYTQQGLAWGLSGRTISKDIIVSGTALSIGDLGVQDLVGQRYDYFHESDDPEKTYHLYTNIDGSWNEIDYETGLEFTNRASANESITIKDMGTIPSNAYQYCLSKNKFKEDAKGNHTMDIHWYLPDVYELQEVLSSGVNSIDIAPNTYYWSSQPSYSGATVNIGTTISIKNEAAANARASSATSTNGVDVARTAKNRVRCFYSSEGIKNVDMSNRAPDGMGGVYSFYMTAHKDGNKSDPGFFQYMLPDKVTTNSSTDYPYTDSQYKYPTFSDYDNAEFRGFENDMYFEAIDENNTKVCGFKVNPAAVGSWRELATVGDYVFYRTLYKYPGLTAKATTDYSVGALSSSRELTDDKTNVKTEEETSTIKLTKTLESTTDLRTLDHVQKGNILSISFDKRNGNNPQFIYDELYEHSRKTYTKKWKVPTYESDSYTTKADNKTIEYTVTVTYTGTSQAKISDYDFGKISAFGNFVIDLGLLGKYEFGDGAYSKAKKEALAGVKAIIEASYSHYSFDYDDARYTELSWNSEGPNLKYKEVEKHSSWGTTYRTYECTCTVTCYVDITLAGGTFPYFKDATNAGWGEAVIATSTSQSINTDELRMYCGNSFSISVNDPNYEISKVKVYFKGGNQIKTTTLPVSSTHARFVDSTLIPTDGSNIIKTESKSLNFESVDVIQLNGMDYSANSSSGEVWQQWSGNGRSSVTLVLADYHIQNGDWTNWTESIYTYKIADTDLSKYFIIDRIEVKCTKKATAATE